MKQSQSPPSLRDIVEPLFRFKGVFVLCALSVWIPVTAYTFCRYLMSPLYEARCKILIERKNIGNLLSAATSPGYSLLDSEIEILMSRPVLQSAMKKITSEGLTEDDMKEIIEGLSVIPASRTNVLEITLRHKDRDILAPFVNNLTQEYIRKRHIINRDMALAAGKFFEQEKEDVSKQLTEMRGGLKEFKTRANLSSIEEQKRIYLQRMEGLSGRSKEIETHIRMLEDKVEKISAEMKKPKDRIEIAPYLERIPESVTKMETLLLELKVKKSDMKQINRLLGELNNKKQEILLNEQERIRLAIEENRLEQVGVSNQIAGYQQKIRDVEDKKVVVDGYKQTIKDLEEIRGALTKSFYRAREVGDIEEQGPVSIYIIEDAVTPKEPVEPRPALYSFLAGIVGLCFGLVVVYLWNYFDHSFRSATDVTAFVESPLLATFTYAQVTGSQLNPFLWKESLDILKACKRVQDTVLNDEGKERSQSIIFAGSTSGEGATTIASNMATFLSSSGDSSSILLIDANSLNPALHDVFNMSWGNGLGEVISGRANIEDVAKRAGEDRLAILTCDKTDERIDISQIGKVMDMARDSFDLIIVDCPPILESSTGLNWCRRGDEVVYIIEAEKTRAQTVKHVQLLFKQDGIVVKGIVLNKKRKHIPDFVYRLP